MGNPKPLWETCVECQNGKSPTPAMGNMSGMSSHGNVVDMPAHGNVSGAWPHFVAPPAPPKEFFTEILWNFLYRIKRDAPPAPPRIPQKFHNFLDFYTAPPKCTHAPPKFTHFRSMSSGDIWILVEWLKVTISQELPKCTQRDSWTRNRRT